MPALRPGRLLRQHLPELAQEQHVGPQRLAGRSLRRGAHDVAAGLARSDERLHELAQPGPLLLGLDARGNAHAVPERHVDQVARWDRDERGQAGTLGPERILEYLNEDVPAFVDEFADVFGTGRLVGILGVGRLHDVGHVQECRALETDVDEGRLHAGQYARDTAFVQVAGQAHAACALDEEFLQHAVLEQRRTRLARADVDDHLRGHAPPRSVRPSTGASSSQVS